MIQELFTFENGILLAGLVFIVKGCMHLSRIDTNFNTMKERVSQVDAEGEAHRHDCDMDRAKMNERINNNTEDTKELKETVAHHGQQINMLKSQGN